MYSFMDFENQESNLNINLSDKNIPNIKVTSILFSSVVVLIIVFSGFLTTGNFTSNIILSQIFIILIPPLILIGYYKFDLKQTLRLHKVSFKNIVFSLSILIFSYPIIIFINSLLIFVTKQSLDEFQANNIPVAQTLPQLLLFIFIIGVMPGVCEEVLMRGFILKGFERLGMKWAIFISSALFGLMHIHFLKIFPTFLLGLIIAFTVYRTNSIFTGMILHFFNNSLATLLLFGVTKISPVLENQMPNIETNQIDFESFSQNEKLILIGFFVIFFSIVLTLTFTILNFVIKKFMQNTNSLVLPQRSLPKKVFSPDLFWLLPGISIILLHTF